jgi:hypothetical protein
MYRGCIKNRKIEKTVTTGIIVGKQDRERQQENILDSLTKWQCRRMNTELINFIRDRT